MSDQCNKIEFLDALAKPPNFAGPQRNLSNIQRRQVSDHAISEGDSSDRYKERFSIERVVSHQYLILGFTYIYLAHYADRSWLPIDCKDGMSIYQERKLSEGDLYSFHCLLGKKECHVLIFEVCYGLSAPFSRSDLYHIGETLPVFRFFPYGIFGILKLSDGLDSFFVMYVANFLTGHLYQKRFKTLVSNDFFARSLSGV